MPEQVQEQGCALPSWGSGGLPPEKEINFAVKIMQLWASFWYFFPILQQKVGDYSQS